MLAEDALFPLMKRSHPVFPVHIVKEPVGDQQEHSNRDERHNRLKHLTKRAIAINAP
jgi:hypothetical protein